MPDNNHIEPYAIYWLTNRNIKRSSFHSFKCHEDLHKVIEDIVNDHGHDIKAYYLGDQIYPNITTS